MQIPQDGNASYKPKFIVCHSSMDFCPKTGHLCCISSHASGLVLEVGFCEHKRTAFVQVNNFEVTDEFRTTDPWIARPTSWYIQNQVQIKSNS